MSSFSEVFFIPSAQDILIKFMPTGRDDGKVSSAGRLRMRVILLRDIPEEEAENSRIIYTPDFKKPEPEPVPEEEPEPQP